MSHANHSHTCEKCGSEFTCEEGTLCEGGRFVSCETCEEKECRHCGYVYTGEHTEDECFENYEQHKEG